MAGTGAGGGETAKDPSGFTVDTIHQYIDAILQERDRRYEQRFQTQQESLTVALAASHAVLVEHDKRYEQRFAAQENATALALSRVDKEFHEHLQQVRTETKSALDAAEKAITKAEAATDKRFDSVNEFRAQLTDQTARFMPRVESLQRHEQTSEKIALLESRHTADIGQINSRLDLTAGRGIGIEKGWSLLIGLAGLVGGIIAIIVTFAR